MDRYRFKASSRLPAARAQKIGEHLNTLAVRGALTAESVLVDAKKKRSPIHDLFEWDDTEAACKYRLDQARHLLRSVEVVYHKTPQQVEPVRAFVTIRDCDAAESSEYMRTITVLSTPEHRQALLSQARKEMREWAARYRHLSELAAVVDAIDKDAA